MSTGRQVLCVGNVVWVQVVVVDLFVARLLWSLNGTCYVRFATVVGIRFLHFAVFWFGVGLLWFSF